MRSVGIEQMSRRRVCSLSDGECQKTMIAKALAQQTRIIILRLGLLTDGALTQGTPQELAASGAIERYIGRPDVTLNRRTLEISINTDNYDK